MGTRRLRARLPDFHNGLACHRTRGRDDETTGMLLPQGGAKPLAHRPVHKVGTHGEVSAVQLWRDLLAMIENLSATRRHALLPGPEGDRLLLQDITVDDTHV